MTTRDPKGPRRGRPGTHDGAALPADSGSTDRPAIAGVSTGSPSTGSPSTGSGSIGAAAAASRPATGLRTAATPWGQASVLEEARLAQRAGEKRFGTVVELLQTPRGIRLLRIAYTTDGVVRRGPVTLRTADLDRLRAALARRPGLAAAFGLGGDD